MYRITWSMLLKWWHSSTSSNVIGVKLSPALCFIPVVIYDLTFCCCCHQLQLKLFVCTLFIFGKLFATCCEFLCGTLTVDVLSPTVHFEWFWISFWMHFVFQKKINEEFILMSVWLMIQIVVIKVCWIKTNKSLCCFRIISNPMGIFLKSWKVKYLRF